MELEQVFWGLSVPLLATLTGIIWRSAANRAEQLQSRADSLGEKISRLEVKVARLEATLESSRG